MKSWRRAIGLFVALGAFALPLAFLRGFAKAETPAPPNQVITITPSTTHPEIKPGDSLQGSFQIINQGDSAYELNLYTAPYSVKTESYTPDFEPLPGKTRVADWIKLTPTQANIQPNESLSVHYTIAVPEGTAPGGYYAVAFAETKAPSGGHGVVVNERVGEIFYIDVAGPVEKLGKILSWGSSFFQKSPVTASLRLENSGGIDYTSNVNIAVKDLFGNTKFQFNTQKVVLPQTIRDIPIDWQNAPALGIFKIQGTVSIFGANKTLPTKYVLVVSPLLRKVFIAIVLLIIAWIAGRLFSRCSAQRRHKHPKTPEE